MRDRVNKLFQTICATLSLSNNSYVTFSLGEHIEHVLFSSCTSSLTLLQAGRSRVRFPVRSLFVINFLNPSSRTMALGSTQPLTEMSTRNPLRGTGQPARKVDNLTAICEPIF
jgi:hypothetical protein